ncbi:MAG: hypothetical protein FWC70_08885 [Defluviitaleaceae bacterium]|nr:hypothetical protein [Defluviitaleaceae bacterium]
MRIALRIDPNRQWFVSLCVVLQGRKAEIAFKVDNGCNALVLSHDTMKKLGFSTAAADLEKLPNKTGRLASGEKHIFKNLGAVSLYRTGKQPVHICNAEAICHATHETNDLIGTEVLNQFTDVNFHLSGNKYMELLK